MTDGSPSETALAADGPGSAEALAAAIDLEEGQRLERLYLFDPVERGGTSFSLAFVVKRLSGDRLEMVAIGWRALPGTPPAHDFVRRARFPEPVLPHILTEFIDRCGVEGAAHREVALSGDGPPAEQAAELAERIRASSSA